MARRWKNILLGGALTVALGGCAETLPLSQLPELTKLPQKVLTKEEQQRTVNEMIEKGQTHQVEAAREIEKAR
jgi:hypothetical protein